MDSRQVNPYLLDDTGAHDTGIEQLTAITNHLEGGSSRACSGVIDSNAGRESLSTAQVEPQGTAGVRSNAPFIGFARQGERFPIYSTIRLGLAIALLHTGEI